jgi:hypothetical protein
MDRRDDPRYPRSTKDDLLNEGRGVENRDVDDTMTPDRPLDRRPAGDHEEADVEGGRRPDLDPDH